MHDLEHVLGLTQVAQAMHAEIHQLDVRVAHELAGRE